MFVFTNDSRAYGKHQRDIELVTDCIQQRSGVVSTQVLQEYAVTALEKLHQDLDVVLRQLAFLESLEIVLITR